MTVDAAEYGTATDTSIPTVVVAVAVAQEELAVPEETEETVRVITNLNLMVQVVVLVLAAITVQAAQAAEPTLELVVLEEPVDKVVLVVLAETEVPMET